MKILHLSTFDTAGGAARASYRIHQSLKNAGVDSQMLVQYKKGNDHTVSSFEDKVRARLKLSIDALPLMIYPDRKHWFSLQWVPNSIAKKVNQINPDIINLNWICNGYLSVETIAKLNKPLVWTLQDLWPFTGGCHYNYGCDRYEKDCGSCPQLNSHSHKDLSHRTWQRKAKAWKNLNLTIVAPSHWIAECAASSSLFQNSRIEVIPFGLDTTKYKPINKQVAREALNLPRDKQLVLFGAISATEDQRKGFHLLVPALKNSKISEGQEKIELVVFGSQAPENPLDINCQVNYLGNFNDDFSLALAYSAADVMVVPSIQESFGQTASESLACGTPVVAFDATGLKDIVDHQQNGYLAQPFAIEDLARGIDWVLGDPARHQQLSQRARQKAEQEFAFSTQASRYLSLFTQLVPKLQATSAH